MKKLVMMLVCMFAVHTMVMADNDKPIQVNQLPTKAQNNFIKGTLISKKPIKSGQI